MTYYIEILDWSKNSFIKARKTLGMSVHDVDWYMDGCAYSAETTDAFIELKNRLVRFYNECFIAERVPLRFSTQYYIKEFND